MSRYNYLTFIVQHLISGCTPCWMKLNPVKYHQNTKDQKNKITFIALFKVNKLNPKLSHY